ncbi:MAG: class II aldolase/adducin family protein, partial [Rhodospirillaceae bacterium]|nr:class II aldolase/adducin family protein [Rhodospirillaceae bacterium]
MSAAASPRALAAVKDSDVRGRVSAAEWQVRVDLAACYRLAYQYGWDDLIFTHMSARVPDAPDQYLLNPMGLLFD